MNFHHILPRLSVIATAAAMASCAALPVEPPPGIESPPQTFTQAHGLGRGVHAKSDWWTALRDPVLDALISQGLVANLDLQQAAQRVLRSRALAAGQRADRHPSGAISVGGQAIQFSVAEMSGLESADRRDFKVTAGVGLSWELDLFGRLDQRAQAAEARSIAVASDAEALRLAIGAEIAHVWFALNGAREQLQLTRSVLENRSATLGVALRRVSAGYNAPLDEARARADLAAAESDLPEYEATVTVATHRLALLLGVSPSSYTAPAAMNVKPQSITLHVPEPAQWMALRPDLKAAETQLRAQALDVAAIRTEFMPRLTMGGALSFVAGAVSGLGAASSASWFLAPRISVPVFDQGRISARLQAAQADQREALLAYRQRVLVATEEVENALVRVRQGQLRLAALQDRAHHASVAESLARKRFEAGTSDQLELLDAQRIAQQAELGLSGALTGQRQLIVALYRALGARFIPVAENG